MTVNSLVLLVITKSIKWIKNKSRKKAMNWNNKKTYISKIKYNNNNIKKNIFRKYLFFN